MCTVWHVDKYKITFKLVINSRRICRGPVYLMPGPGTGPRPGGWEILVYTTGGVLFTQKVIILQWYRTASIFSTTICTRCETKWHSYIGCPFYDVPVCENVPADGGFLLEKRCRAVGYDKLERCIRSLDRHTNQYTLNPLAPELCFLMSAHPVYTSMWIIQEPNKLAFWNKLHFEEKKKTESIEHV